MRFKTLAAALTLGLASLSLPALALTPGAPPVPGTLATDPAAQSRPHRGHDADPQQREEWRKQHEARRAECAANPEQCRQQRAEHRRQRQEKCMADAACKTRLEARKAKHEERRKACAADPEKCKAERAERRQRYEARRAKCTADADCKSRMEQRKTRHEQHGKQDDEAPAVAN